MIATKLVSKRGFLGGRKPESFLRKVVHNEEKAIRTSGFNVWSNHFSGVAVAAFKLPEEDPHHVIEYRVHVDAPVLFVSDKDGQSEGPMFLSKVFRTISVHDVGDFGFVAASRTNVAIAFPERGDILDIVHEELTKQGVASRISSDHSMIYCSSSKLDPCSFEAKIHNLCHEINVPSDLLVVRKKKDKIHPEDEFSCASIVLPKSELERTVKDLVKVPSFADRSIGPVLQKVEER